jgi:hypothetical protein
MEPLPNRWPAILYSNRLIWIVLGLAVLLRTGFAVHTPNPNMEWDANSYRMIGHHLALGEGYTLNALQPNTYWAHWHPF